MKASISHSPEPGQALLPSLAVAGSGALWGVFWVPLRYFDEQGVNAGWASLIFFLVTAIAVLPFVVRAFPRLAAGNLISGLLTGTAFTLYTVSLVHTEVVRALLLFYLTPVWSTLLGFLFMGHVVTRHRAMALVLGITGLLVVLDYRGPVPLPRNTGDWMALASGVIWAFATIRLYSRGAAPIPDTVFAFALGGLASSLVILALPRLDLGAAPVAGALSATLPVIVAFSLVAFVPTNLLILWGSQRLNPGRVGVLLMTECVVGTATAALFSGEPFGLREALGSVLIVGAGAVEVMRRTARS
jgi:drug/metabolite transporter (DMT)-like permease